jgi:hypothetical protein
MEFLWLASNVEEFENKTNAKWKIKEEAGERKRQVQNREPLWGLERLVVYP